MAAPPTCIKGSSAGMTWVKRGALASKSDSLRAGAYTLVARARLRGRPPGPTERGHFCMAPRFSWKRRGDLGGRTVIRASRPDSSSPARPSCWSRAVATADPSRRAVVPPAAWPALGRSPSGGGVRRSRGASVRAPCPSRAPVWAPARAQWVTAAETGQADGWPDRAAGEA